MKRLSAVGLAVVLVVAAAQSLLAHHSLALFETTTAVRVKGVIADVAWINPHTIVYVDEKRADGKVQRWAAEGPAAQQLERRSIGRDVFRVGDEVAVCGYTLKEENTTSAPPSGRRLAAEDVVFWDGKKRPWGDYGHHNCHSGDDPDVHPISRGSSAPTGLDFPRRPPQ
jgi:hypothetical protein